MMLARRYGNWHFTYGQWESSLVKPFWKATWQLAVKTREVCGVPFDMAIPIQSFILRRSSYMHAKIQGSILHNVYNSREREISSKCPFR